MLDAGTKGIGLLPPSTRRQTSTTTGWDSSSRAGCLRDHEIHCWHDYGGDRRRERLCAVHGFHPGLRAGLG